MGCPADIGSYVWRRGVSAVKASVSGDALGRVQKKERESLRCKVHGGSGLGSVSCRSVWDDGYPTSGQGLARGLAGLFSWVSGSQLAVRGEGAWRLVREGLDDDNVRYVDNVVDAVRWVGMRLVVPVLGLRADADRYYS